MTHELDEKRAQRCKWRNKSYQKHKREISQRAKDKREKNKRVVIYHYTRGKMKCEICGFGDIRALQIDHIDNDGSQHRKSTKRANLYTWIIQNNFPKRFQVLCANCNWIKREEIYVPNTTTFRN